ncbi:MAG: hypothetical protein HY075_13810 [Deltaproteobacteria bacterium]|nr:hypothetical protein [Deltaproteobacteria bacterium]
MNKTTRQAYVDRIKAQLNYVSAELRIRYGRQIEVLATLLNPRLKKAVVKTR